MMDGEESGPGCQCLEEINEEHIRIHWSLKEKESSFLTHWRETGWERGEPEEAS